MVKQHNYSSWYNKNKEIIRIINSYYPRHVESIMLKDYDKGLKMVESLDKLIKEFLDNYGK